MARNNGLSLACGDYLMFVDGDDYLSIDACEKLYKKIIQTGSDIAIGGVMAFSSERMFPYRSYKDKDRTHITTNT